MTRCCSVLLTLLLVSLVTIVTAREQCKLTRRLYELRCANMSSHYLPTEWLWSFDDDVHGFSSELRRLEITHSNITTLQRHSFKRMPQLTQVLLTHLHLQEVEQAAFTGITRLRWVDLSHNLIESIPVDTFKDTRLAHLKLDGNTNLTVPTNGPLLNAGNLAWLSLRNCSIQHLPGSAFQVNTMLSHLDLSHNLLEMLPEQIFTTNERLVYLDLSFNRFQTLDFSVIQSVPLFPQQPNSLILSGNRWVCNCKLARLIQWGNQNPTMEAATWVIHPKDSRLRKAVQCSAPGELAGREWLTLQDTVFNC